MDLVPIKNERHEVKENMSKENDVKKVVLFFIFLKENMSKKKSGGAFPRLAQGHHQLSPLCARRRQVIGLNASAKSVATNSIIKESLC